jgi:hypothetical protein
MNLANAFVFLVMGTVMEVLPGVFPAWFPRTGLDGTSASSLWLHLMGFVGTGISTVFCLARYAVPAVLNRMRTAKGAAAAGRGGFIITGARSLDTP